MRYNHLLLDGGFKSKGDFFGGDMFNEGILGVGSGGAEKKSSSASLVSSAGSSGLVTTYEEVLDLLRASMNTIISSIDASSAVQSMLLSLIHI